MDNNTDKRNPFGGVFDGPQQSEAQHRSGTMVSLAKPGTQLIMLKSGAEIVVADEDVVTADNGKRLLVTLWAKEMHVG